MKKNKLSFLLMISAVVMAIGVLFFFLFGFNLSENGKDRKSVAVTYDSYITIDEKLKDQVRDVCEEGIKANGLNITYVKESVISGGGIIEFFFRDSVGNETLEKVKTEILAKLSAEGELSNAVYEGAVHEYAARNFTKDIVRAAIAGAVILVFVFAYMWIRFKLNIALLSMLIPLHNVLLVVALTLICRIPVSASFVAGLAFAVCYAVFATVVAFAEIRNTLKNEDVKLLSSEEATQAAVNSVKKPSLSVAIITAIALSVVAVLSLFYSSGIMMFALPALFAVIISLYSSCVLIPLAYAPLKNAADRRAKERSAYDYKLKNKKENKAAEKISGDID